MKRTSVALAVLFLSAACRHAGGSGASSSRASSYREGRGPKRNGIRETRIDIRPRKEAAARYGGSLEHALNDTEATLAEWLRSNSAQEVRALSRMARELAATAPHRHDVPPALVDELMAWAGLVHPPPRVIVAEIGNDVHGCAEQPGDPCEEFMRNLAGQARDAMGPLNNPMYGVGVARVADGEGLRVVIAVLEPAVEIEPMPVSVALGESITVRGALLGNRSKPRVEMVDAAGQWSRLEVSSRGKGFSASIPCSRPAGSLQIEVLAEGRHGPEVAANFPIYCGAKPPPTLRVVVEFLQEDVTPQQVARANFEYLNAEREQRGLSPLVWDERAAEIARDHSEDMVRSGFVGHQSPTTGDVSDRFQRAKLEAIHIRENVARGYGPKGIHESLMRSPGHRVNILAEDVTHVGIGMVISQSETSSTGGRRPVFATQNFFRPPGSDAPGGDLDLELRAAVDRRRKAAGLAPVKWDEVLAAEAERHAEALANGRDNLALRPNVEARVVKLGAKGVDAHQVRTNAFEGLVQFDLWQRPLPGFVGLGVARTGTKRSTKGFVLVVLVAL